MYIHNDSIVTSASDLTAASHCEFAVLRKLDATLGRIDPVAKPEDAMLERASKLGDAHERRILDDLVRSHPGRVIEIPQPDVRDDASLRAAVDATAAAFAAGIDVVFQATFANEEFIGFADFIVRQPDGRYMVQDSKLARTPRVTALMQLAAYVDQLDRLGVARAHTVELLLGDGTVSAHRVDDIMPVFRRQWARLRAMVDERFTASEALEWGDPRYRACGRCEWCEPEVERARDLLLVAGMRPTQRARLIEGGIRTIDALAIAPEPPATMGVESFNGLRTQAQLQLESAASHDGVPPFRVAQPEALAAIPAPSAGDLFFDFEGDPLYTEGQGRWWGLDYLFGWVDANGQFDALWAHSFAEERTALERFIAFVLDRRAQHPEMHIYHYAPYETSHLAAMAARYGICEAEVDALLRDGVFIDLYPIVRRALRVGSRSYSIKMLEPLYMGEDSRTDMAVTKGDQSIEVYLSWRTAVAEGRDSDAAEILRGIADYNEYDCVSTLKLRDWMLGLARARGIDPAVLPPELRVAFEESPTAVGLRERAKVLEEGAELAEATALRLAAAALDYYPRERKTYWAEHFMRLEQPVESWAESGNVLLVDRAESAVARPWFREGRQQKQRRHLELRGTMAPGFTLRAGDEVFVLYEPPLPFAGQSPRPHMRGVQEAVVIEVLGDDTSSSGLLIEETAFGGDWSTLPMAVAPGRPLFTKAQEDSIASWAARLLADDELGKDPATDILLRRPQRPEFGAGVPRSHDLAHGGDYVDAVTGAVHRLQQGFVAVQGPPGTGKTYVGSRVIARLVREQGWRVGVVAQSHRVIENVLDGVVAAGLDRSLVAKALSGSKPEDHVFTALAGKGAATAFASEHAATGFVLGGTAWDFANATRIPRGSLDLLVIDEAGQFSLANTIAVSLAAPRLLLLGDPQQLPQVSQGTHPEPVDTSALGWVIGEHAVLPDDFGFFLGESWRMHPAVAAPVSTLSYEGELASHPSAALRRLEGVEAGLHIVPIDHRGNSISSPEEADEIVRIARKVLGRAWTEVRVDAAGLAIPQPPRSLEQSDIIVVTPYNAQLQCVRQALDAAGLTEVPVGTVDKFQGQEAAVAIVTLAASSAADAPRGIEFLLLRNRLNVAISRAKYAAYLVHAPALLDDLPRTPQGVAQLSAFARLVGQA